MMFLELDRHSVVSAAAFATRDVPALKQDPSQEAIRLAVHIAKRGGGDIPAKHAAVIGMAATIVIAQSRPAASPAPPARRKNSGVWAQQGRALVQASHNVAHRAAQPRIGGWLRKAPQPTNFAEGSAK
jgi:hypothetical protein